MKMLYRVDLYDAEYGDLDSVEVFEGPHSALNCLRAVVAENGVVADCEIEDGTLVRVSVVKRRDPDFVLACLYSFVPVDWMYPNQPGLAVEFALSQGRVGVYRFLGATEEANAKP